MTLSNNEQLLFNIFNSSNVITFPEIQQNLPQASEEEINLELSNLRNKNLIYKYDNGTYAITRLGRQFLEDPSSEDSTPLFNNYNQFLTIVRAEVLPHLISNHPEYESLLNFLINEGHSGFLQPLYSYIKNEKFPLYPGETNFSVKDRVESSIEDQILLWVDRLKKYGPNYQGKLPPVSKALSLVTPREQYQSVLNEWEINKQEVFDTLSSYLSKTSTEEVTVITKKDVESIQNQIRSRFPKLFHIEQLGISIFNKTLEDYIDSNHINLLLPSSSLQRVVNLLRENIKSSNESVHSVMSKFILTSKNLEIKEQDVFENLFSNYDFSGLNFSSARFNGAKIENSNFSNTDFSNSNLSKVSFTNCNFENARLTSCDLSTTNFSNCNFDKADFAYSVVNSSIISNNTGNPLNIKIREAELDNKSLPTLRQMPPIYVGSFALSSEDENDAKTVAKALQGILTHRSIISSMLKFSSDVDELREWLASDRVPQNIQDLKNIDKGMFRGVGWLNKLNADGTLRNSGFTKNEVNQLFDKLKNYFGMNIEAPKKEKPEDINIVKINSFIEKYKETNFVLKSDLINLLSRSEGTLYDYISELPEKVNVQTLQNFLTSLVSSIKDHHVNSYVPCKRNYTPFPSVSRIHRQDSTRASAIYGDPDKQIAITLEPVLNLAPKEVIQAFRVTQGDAESGTHAGIHYHGFNVCHSVITPMSYINYDSSKKKEVKKVWLVSEIQSDAYQKANKEVLAKAMKKYKGDVQKFRQYFTDWSINLLNTIIQKAGDQGIDQVWVPKSTDMGGGSKDWTKQYDVPAKAFGGKLTNLGTSIAPNPKSGIAEDSVSEVYVIEIPKEDVVSKLSWQIEEDFVREEIDEDGDLFRYNSKGRFHSLYSPATEYKDGTKQWSQNGKSHRLDGPAYEGFNGYKSWYYEGKCYGDSRNGYNQEKFEEDLRREGKIASKKLSWQTDEEDYVREETNSNGDLRRLNSENKPHSLYSPAIEYGDGDIAWYKNGDYHRLDGPAFESNNPPLRSWWYEGIKYGNSTKGYTQEKFEQDLRERSKI